MIREYKIGHTEVELLRKYKIQKSYTNSQLETEMEAFGGDWDDEYLDKLFKGKIRPDDAVKRFIKAFLLNRYFEQTLG